MHTSLQGTLQKWLLVIVAIFGIAGSLVSFGVAYFHAKDLQDDLLEQISNWLRVAKTIEAAPLVDDYHEEHDEEQIVIQALGANTPLRLPTELTPGFHNVDLEGDHDTWRILVIEHKKELYAIAQQTELREEIAFGSAVTSTLPLMLFSLVLFGGLRIIIRKSFLPINALAREVNERDSNELSQLKNDQVPTEIRPFIDAINRMLIRVEKSIKRQQRFIADAAHELRTPVAGLSLLAENQENNQETDARLLQSGLKRLQTLVEQLLNLARLQSDTPVIEKTVFTHEVLKEVVLSLYPLADQKSLDLGVVQNDAMEINDKDNGLWQIFQNGISNAIRYTPEGGAINISCTLENNKMIFQVEDTGPGISPDALEHIFEPFHRDSNHANESNGLGLTICKQIADNNNGELVLENLTNGGARFRYIQAI